jgi:uncharacterized protein
VWTRSGWLLSVRATAWGASWSSDLSLGGTATPDSDVDVLYELLPGRVLGWEIEQFADELSEVLGRSVDLVSLSALHRRLREPVLAEARPLYAA